MKLFNRKWQLLIGKIGSTGVLIKGIRVAFEIEMTDDRTTNKGKISIYNLSDETIGVLEQKDASIIVQVAYDEEEFSTLFIGNIVKFETKFSGVDVITEVTCHDGYIPLTRKKLSLSFAGGSSTHQIVERIVGELNLTKGDYSALPNLVYEQGFAFIGSPGSALNIVLERIGYEWTITNNVLIISKPNESAKEVYGQLLTPNTGLLNKPERFKEIPVKTKKENNKLMDGWKIKSLIIPSLQPKSLIKVQLDDYSGVFLIKAVKFTGDTHDKDWYAEIDAILK